MPQFLSITQNDSDTTDRYGNEISPAVVSKRGRKPLDPRLLKRNRMKKEAKKPKTVYACPHTDKKFYAKGYC